MYKMKEDGFEVREKAEMSHALSSWRHLAEFDVHAYIW